MALDNKPVEAITEANLQALMENQVAEAYGEYIPLYSPFVWTGDMVDT